MDLRTSSLRTSRWRAHFARVRRFPFLPVAVLSLLAGCADAGSLGPLDPSPVQSFASAFGDGSTILLETRHVANKCIAFPDDVAVLAPCNDDAAQRFVWETNGEIHFGTLCVTAPANRGQQITVAACTGGSSQTWTGTTADEIRGRGDLCVDINGARKTDGAPIILWTCNGQTNQKWRARTISSAPAPIARLTVSGQGQSIREGGTLDLTIDAGEVVTLTLDGTRSVAGTGSLTSYEWTSNGAVVGSAATGTVQLGQGSYTIALTVADGSALTATATATVNLVTEEDPPLGGQLISLVTRHVANKCIEIQSERTVLATCDGGVAQQFVWESTGALRFGSLCLTAPAAQGQQILVAACTGQNDQKWTLTSAQEIRGIGGLCIDIGGAKKVDGAVIITWTCNGQTNQKWTTRTLSTAPSPTARLTVSGQGQSVQEGGTLDLTIDSDEMVTLTLDGTRSVAGTGSLTSYEWTSNGVVVGTAATGSVQLGEGSFTIALRVTDGSGLTGAATVTVHLAVSESPPVGGAPISLVTRHVANKCIQIQNGQTVLGTCNGAAAQQFVWEPTGALRFGALCLTAPSAQGQPLVVAACTGAGSQRWTPTSAEEIRDASGLCVDINGARKTDGAPIIIWTCNGQTNQKWTTRALSIAPGDSVRVVTFGDSNTDWGYLTGSGIKARAYVACSDPNNSTCLDATDPPSNLQLAGKVLAKWQIRSTRPVRVVNHAISGTTTGGDLGGGPDRNSIGSPNARTEVNGVTRFEGAVLGRAYPWSGGEPAGQWFPGGSVRRVQAFTPSAEDFAYISLGTNDPAAGMTAAQTLANLEWMIDEWVAAGNQADHLFITTLAPIYRAGQPTASIPTINNGIRSLANEKGARLIELATYTSNDNGLTWKNDALHVGDRVHYTTEVRDWLADQIVDWMIQFSP